VPSALDDCARFRLDDPEEVVAASFACPICLHDDCAALLDQGQALAVARCACAICDARWDVGVDAQQLLRLSLDPPAAIGLRWSDRVGGLRQLWDLGPDDLGPDFL
jgi:hypothetical protein